MDEGDAPQKGGRYKTGQIADNAASQGYYGTVALHASCQGSLVEVGDYGKLLGPFPFRHHF